MSSETKVDDDNVDREESEKSEQAGTGRKVDLDTILKEELGEFGLYQLRTLLALALILIFGACTGEYIFTAARIPTRCKIPECDGPNPEFSPAWQSNAIPTLDNGAYDQCARFSSTNISTQYPDACPTELFDTTSTEPCWEYVYENDHSVVYDFDIGCDEWRRSLIGTIRTAGMLLVLPLSGYVSDRWGRRTAVIMNTFNCAWIGIARAFVNSYEWFMALQVLESALGNGGFPCCYILVTELVGPKYRVAAGAMLSTFFALGSMFLGLIAWWIPNWRTLTLVIYVPQLLLVAFYFVLSESVRWLMSKGRYEESEKILKNVAKTNKKVLSEKSVAALRESVEEEKRTVRPDEPWLVLQVLRSPVILKRCCITPFWWITMTMVYYGLSLNAVNLSGNQYANFAIVSAIEIPGFWTSILLLDRVGRKPVIIAGFWICAICQFIFAFLPEGMDTFSLVVYMFGKYCISLVVTSLYIYTTELYPTKYRNNLFAFSSMLGRIGSITAPLTPALAQEVWAPFPSVLFGSFSFVSGLLVLLTPETLDIKLADTFEEAENLHTMKIK